MSCKAGLMTSVGARSGSQRTRRGLQSRHHMPALSFMGLELTGGWLGDATEAAGRPVGGLRGIGASISRESMGRPGRVVSLK